MNHAPKLQRPVPLPALASKPMVSILMANYNYAHFVSIAVESVQRQTYGNWELIICDDGSVDRSAEVIGRYAKADPRVKLIRSAVNSGMAASWNSAYRLSSGQIICLLDADDLYEPPKLQRVVEYFDRNPDSGLMIHPMLVIDQDGMKIRQIPGLTEFEEGFIAERVISRGGRWRYMPTSALSFRRELAELIFPMPEPVFRRTADGFLFTILPMLTPVGVVREPLTRYRLHGGNGMSSNNYDLKTAQRLVDARQRVTRGVNERLEQLGLHECRIKAEDNLNYLEHDFALRLLSRQPLHTLLRPYLRLAGALRRDDLYGRLQKLLGIFIYGLAVLLSVRLRRRWLTMTLQHNRFKEILRKLMTKLRAVRRPRRSRESHASLVPSAAVERTA